MDVHFLKGNTFIGVLNKFRRENPNLEIQSISKHV